MKQSTVDMIAKLKAMTAEGMHHVFVEYDGCLDDKPLYSGQHEACIAVLRTNWRRFNKGKQSLALVSAHTGRCVSFVL